jgi:hypothetical protein
VRLQLNGETLPRFQVTTPDPAFGGGDRGRALATGRDTARIHGLKPILPPVSLLEQGGGGLAMWARVWLAVVAMVGLFAVPVARAQDPLPVAQIAGRVQTALDPQQASWVTAQTANAYQSRGGVDVAALRASARSVLPAPKAGSSNVDALVVTVLVGTLRAVEQDVSRVALQIDKNLAAKKSLREVAARARAILDNGRFPAASEAWTTRRAEAERLAQLLASIEDLKADEESLASELQRRLAQMARVMANLAVAAGMHAQLLDAVVASLRS